MSPRPRGAEGMGLLCAPCPATPLSCGTGQACGRLLARLVHGPPEPCIAAAEGCLLGYPRLWGEWRLSVACERRWKQRALRSGGECPATPVTSPAWAQGLRPRAPAGPGQGNRHPHLPAALLGPSDPGDRSPEQGVPIGVWAVLRRWGPWASIGYCPGQLWHRSPLSPLCLAA